MSRSSTQKLDVPTESKVCKANRNLSKNNKNHFSCLEKWNQIESRRSIIFDTNIQMYYFHLTMMVACIVLSSRFTYNRDTIDYDW